MVVYIVKTEIEAAKNLIHKPLKRLCHFPQPKGHADKLIGAKGGDYGSLGYVVRFNRDVVVRSCDVYFTEDGSTMERCRVVLNR